MNWSGRLGDGTTTQRYAPVRIGTDADWSEIETGTGHTMALKTDGSLWAWGWNAYGQLGDGTILDKYAPIRIGADSNWTKLSGGWGHTLALKSDGTLWAWGYNAYGQLGDGVIPQVLSPAEVVAGGKAVINNGAAYTVDTAVTLTLTVAATDANDISQMRLSNDGTTWSAPEPYAATKTWTLSAGDGTKAVSVMFMDAAGNWSSAYVASIVLDTTPPEVTITSPAAGTTNNKTPLLSYTVSDGRVIVMVDGAVVQKVSGDTFDPLLYGPHTVRVEATDTAGNTGFAEVSFTVPTYTITAAADANGSISPSGTITVLSGDTQAFDIVPLDGYHISDVMVDGASVGTAPTYTFPAVVANHTITASFSNTYAITASAGANGTISPSGTVNITQGTDQIFTFTPNSGYHVVDVIVDGSSVGRVPSYTFSTVSGAHTISASFASDTIINGGTITVNTTWTLAGSPYIVKGNVSVGGTEVPTLTIEPGVVVKFDNNMEITIGKNSTSGALYAVGTSSAPIIFTSNDPAPIPGKWKGISFYSGTIAANSGLEYVTVEYGGGNNSGNIYFQYTSPVTIKNSIIRKSLNRGIYAIGSALVIQNNTITDNNTIGISSANNSALTATGNTITNNGTYGVYDSMGPAVISGNTISGNGSYPVRMGIIQTGNVNTYGTNGVNAIEIIGGAVNQNLTMKNQGLPYIITSDITVGSSSSPILTIEPGVVVKFNNNMEITIGDGSSGALYAVGTSSAPIIFTSNDPSPAPGKWKGISFYDNTIGANSGFEYVTVEYGGGNGSGNIYFQYVSPVTIKNSTIQKSLNRGIYAIGTALVIQNNTITNNNTIGISGANNSALNATGNTITSNGTYGIYDSMGSAAVISGNTISGNGSYPIRMAINQIENVNTYGTNGTNAVEVIGGIVSQNLTMRNIGIPYVMTSSLSIYGTQTVAAMLTVEPGVTVKFGASMGLQIGNGSYRGVLTAKGTASSNVRFTSSQATPAPGAWTGVTLFGNASSASEIEHMIIEYGGQGGTYSKANLVLNQSSPVIMNSTIRNSAGSGVYVTNASNSPVIVNSDITGNKWGVYSSSSNPYVLYNNIHANTTAGVWNATTSMDVDARENWWGAASGPTYAGNSQGMGDTINDHVLFNPWLGQATGGNLSITGARAMPSALNPNGGHITFTAQLSSSATWTVTISDGNGNTVNTLTGSGTSIKQKWYGVDSQAIIVADGPYYYRIDARDPASGVSATSPVGLFMVSSQVPIVYMDPPVDSQMFMGGTTIDITGTISDPTDFKNYTLDYGVGENPGSWTTLKTATTPVTDGLIYAWYTSALTNGLYTLRLTATDYANNVVVDMVRVRLLWIQNAVVSQSYISPNGDGIQDAATISAALSHPSDWTLTLKDSSGSPVKTYSGSGTALSQDWDGTNEAGTIVTDGIYTYQITAVSSETGIQATPATGSINVDTTPPTALITTPVSDSVLWNTVLIEGSASDANIATYEVEYGPAAGNGPWTVINSGTSSVANDTLATWITSDPSLVMIPNGNYIIRLTVTDRAGNGPTASVPVILDNVQLSNVGVSSDSIDTLEAQSTSIFFTINSSATVTLKIIPEKLGSTGTPIYLASQSIAAGGAYSFTWNGQDNTGMTVPDEAYIYILEASDGGKTCAYDPPTPTGTGEMTTCSRSGFDPAKNIPMTVTYAPAQASRVNIHLNWGVFKYKILEAYPATAGVHAFDWDGRNPGNKLLDTDAYSYCSIASLLPENFIITTGDTVKVTDLKTDPYAMSLSYGQFTRIMYTLSRDANVTVKITSPSGSSIHTLVSNQSQSAGPQALDEWTGLNAADPTGKETLITEEGNYMVSVQAVNPVTGKSSMTRANIRIGY